MRTTSTYFWRWNPELGQFRNLWRPSSSSISVFVKTSNRLSPPLPSHWWRPVPVVSPADLGINTNSCWEQELILKREGNTHIQCVLLNQLLRYSPPHNWTYLKSIHCSCRESQKSPVKKLEEILAGCFSSHFYFQQHLHPRRLVGTNLILSWLIQGDIDPRRQFSISDHFEDDHCEESFRVEPRWESIDSDKRCEKC